MLLSKSRHSRESGNPDAWIPANANARTGCPPALAWRVEQL